MRRLAGVETAGNRSVAEVLIDRVIRAGNDVAQEACFMWAKTLRRRNPFLRGGQDEDLVDDDLAGIAAALLALF
jgi:hypothetical protein